MPILVIEKLKGLLWTFAPKVFQKFRYISYNWGMCLGHNPCQARRCHKGGERLWTASPGKKRGVVSASTRAAGVAGAVYCARAETKVERC